MFDSPTQYCERLSGAITVMPEPINFVSSAATFVAAFLAYYYLRQHPQKFLAYGLPVLLGMIGLGSMYWHAFRSPLGDIADTASIIVFASVAGTLFLRKTLQSGVVVAFSLLLLAVAALAADGLDWLNGSMPYVVLLIGFGVVGFIHEKKFPSTRMLTISTLFVFALAIALRSLDLAICPFFPIGTHFLWHILTAVAGFLLILLIAKDS